MTKMIPVIALMTLAACGVSSKKACDRAAECYEELGGDPADFDVDQCVSDMDAAEADADEAGCLSEYKSYLKCGVKADCDDYTACETEYTDFADCMSGATTTTEE